MLANTDGSGLDVDLTTQKFRQDLQRLEALDQNPWFWQKRDSNESVRQRYMDEKISIDSAVIEMFTTEDGTMPIPKLRGTAPQTKKVAFLFLVMESVHMVALWDQFFAGVPAANYSIYTHAALLEDDDPHRTQDGTLKQWNAKAINRVNTSWCALLGVEVALLHAALEDQLNQQFIFLSQDTVPLKSFDYVYRTLFDKPEKSRFCFASAASHTHVLVEAAMDEFHKGCFYKDFYRAHDPRTIKHHQWIILSREHAQTIVGNAKLGLDRWSKTWRVVAPDLPTAGEGCSDESVPATTLLLDMAARGEGSDDAWADLDKLGVEQTCYTYVHWYNCMKTTQFHQPSASFFKGLVERGGDLWKFIFDKDFDFLKQTTLNSFPMIFRGVDLELMRSLVGEGFLFMRKIDPDIVVLDSANQPVPLEEALPKLWAGVDEAYARSHEWSRLEGRGDPSRMSTAPNITY